MNDLLFVGVFAASMVAAFGYVRLCDRIVRADRPGRADGDTSRPVIDERREAVAS